MFALSTTPVFREELVKSLYETQAGALVTFEGWVRNHNEGKKVKSLEYQIYHELAVKEGAKILKEAREKFNLHAIKCVHREGHLQLGDIAVWIGAIASHRDDAFKATRYIIDQIKHRLPVWKKEHYANEEPQWVFCRHHHNHVHFTEGEYYQKQSGLLDQQKLKNSKVLVVGAGGLGCPALIGLASAGVGHISIVDSDVIHISNIHRQPLFAPHLAGEKKADVARTKLLELNPFINVTSQVLHLDTGNAENTITGYDLILDCTDNLQTKFLLHDVCFKLRLPLVSASIFKFEGQLRTFAPLSTHGCLRCHSKSTPDDALLGNCNDFGVTGAVTGMLGSLQAAEAIEFLQHETNSTLTETLYYNLNQLTQFKIKNTKSPDCETCAGRVELKFDEYETEFSAGQLIDIRALTDDEVFAQLNPSVKVILACHRGVRSRVLTKKFRELGHQNVFSLRGGACSL